MVLMLQQPDFEERMAARRSDSGRKAIMGIHPTTKRCEVVATDEPANWLECRDMGLIVVPVQMEKARVSWGELIGDVYALATPNGGVTGLPERSVGKSELT